MESANLSDICIQEWVRKTTARLFAGDAKAGIVNKVVFDSTGMHSGLYFIRTSSGNETYAEKLIILHF